MNPDNPIKEIMSTNLVTVSPENKIAEIMEIFKKNEFHHIPVIEPGEKLAGIISREDCFKFAYLLSPNTTEEHFPNVEFGRLTARDLMTAYPVALDPDDSIGLAADIFLANKFHALPIIDEEALVGIVTTHDLLTYGFNRSEVEGRDGQETLDSVRIW